MTAPANQGRNTKVSRMIHAPRAVIYRAFLEAEAVEMWLPPDGMRGEMHAFEPRVGGVFHLSLTYLEPQDSPRGKTSDDTDTVEGRFVELVPNEKIVQVFEFEADEPEFAGKMTITWSLTDANEGTEVSALCEDIPAGIRLEDNELGSRLSLRNLAKFVEGG